MKVIVTIIPTNMIANLLLSLVYPFAETKTKTKFSARW